MARIKTKPIARYGCLGVLPSFGGKPPNENRDGPVSVPPNITNQQPPGPMPGPTNTPPPPGAYPNQRFFIPPNSAPAPHANYNNFYPQTTPPAAFVSLFYIYSYYNNFCKNSSF